MTVTRLKLINEWETYMFHILAFCLDDAMIPQWVDTAMLWILTVASLGALLIVLIMATTSRMATVWSLCQFVRLTVKNRFSFTGRVSISDRKTRHVLDSFRSKFVLVFHHDVADVFLTYMMTSYNENTFRITGTLCREDSSGFPIQRASNMGFDVFFDECLTNSPLAGD